MAFLSGERQLHVVAVRESGDEQWLANVLPAQAMVVAMSGPTEVVVRNTAKYSTPGLSKLTVRRMM